MPNFRQCGDTFMNEGNGSFSEYIYTGAVYGIFEPTASRPKLITLEGCEVLCGTGPEYYPWADVSATISTWVLPIIGLMLQAPFESNSLLRTLFAIARWIGSPIASLSYILWNIKVTSRCALMVDMG